MERAAPDATAGDGLREEQLAGDVARLLYRYSGHAEDSLMGIAREFVAESPALRDVLAAAARDAELREAVTSLAVRFHTLGEVLHSVPAADAYDDAAESLRDALDPS